MEKPKILIIAGSDSDLPVLEDGLAFLRETGVPYKIDVSSAHRHPEKTSALAKNARGEGFEVVIAAAGLAAHLPGVIAAHTTLPVIGIPMKGDALQGMDALLSIVQMPKGIPVATVGIDAARNACILACQILSLKYPEIAARLDALKEKLKREVEEKSERLANNKGQ
jgi:5-(carboxyamino)imidazole ribonucleotide mutase